MGFGIALIGYACLILIGTGGEIIASLMLAYGFFLASRLNSGFLRASVSSLFILPRGIVNLLSVLGIIDINSLAMLNIITFMLYLFAWLFMSYFWLTAVIGIARDNGAQKLERQARSRLVLTFAFIVTVMFARMMIFTGALGNYGGIIAAAEFILQYIVIFFNVFFLHTCFILITSEKQYEKDKRQIAKSRADALKKSQEEKEGAADFARHRK